MTNEEKRAALAVSLAPDTDTDEVLDNVLADAEALVLNRMYPFGYPDGTVVPARYERIQIQLAAELYSKRGAEGHKSRFLHCFYRKTVKSPCFRGRGIFLFCYSARKSP